MTEPNDLSSRMEKLETLLAYQEQTIEELNTALSEQANEIDALKRRLAKLGDELASVSAHPALSPEDEPPPPHY